MRILKLIPVILATLSFLRGYAQITNVRAVQKENNIEIKFDLSEDISKIYFYLSQDGGKTFDDNTIKSISGLSENLKAGVDKTIVWNTLKDIDHLVCENLIILVNNLPEGIFIDQRDNRTYKTIIIGTQTWMAENLAYKASNGCLAYNKNQGNAATYGYLYNWETAQNAAPSGWHLPSNDEWATLVNYLGGVNVAGGKMKSITGWTKPNTDATNESRFNALPAGYFTSDFYYLGDFAFFWSITSNGNEKVWSWELNCTHGQLIRRDFNSPKSYFSVRCIKD